MEFTAVNAANRSVVDSTFLVQPAMSDTELVGGSIESNASTFEHGLVRERRWFFLGLFVLPLWILFGNLLVLISVIGFRHLRTLSNWVIASLAFTDFLLAITVVPLGIYQLVSLTLFQCVCVLNSVLIITTQIDISA